MKISIKKMVAVIVILAIFVVAAIVFFSKQAQIRKVDGTKHYFSFPEHGTEKIVEETRILPKDAPQGELNFYVDELLLGPATPRLRPLFSLGTSAEYCFVKNSVLYVGLTRDAVLQMGDSADIKTGVKLFKDNIKENFKDIKEIQLFIDGKYLEN